MPRTPSQDRSTAAEAGKPETPEPAPSPEPTPSPEKVATVTKLPNGWALVEHGTWQLSVDPTGLIMLPRHLEHTDVSDFVGGALAAQEVAAKIKADNEEAGKNDSTQPAPRRIRVGASGSTQPGYARLPVKPSGEPQPRAAIGRRKISAPSPPARGGQR